jgi:hypothetical protein
MKLLAPITFEEIPRTGMMAWEPDLPHTMSEREAFLKLAERRGGPLSERPEAI